MQDKKNYTGCTNGVGCDVLSCKYHTENNVCCAGHIEVESNGACCSSKSETYCSTYKPK